MKRPRDKQGRLGGNAYSDDDFLDAVRGADLPTTGDVADAVGCSRQTAHKRLRALEDDGQLDSKKVGSALVWSLVD